MYLGLAVRLLILQRFAGQADGPGAAMQEARDLVWLCWGLALPWPWRSRKRRASQVGDWREGQDG